MGFIYKVTNKINQKVYIGKTLESVEKRYKEHCQEAKNKRTNHRPFHFALNKYGIENFEVETLEEVDNSIIDAREQYWIQYYQSYILYGNGYNATLGGDGTIKYDYYAIVQDYLKTKSKEQTANNFCCCLETVRKACDAFDIQNFNNSAGRKIQRISDDGSIVEYESIRQAALEIAELTGKNFQTVRKRINAVVTSKIGQKAYGYKWKI